MRSNWLEWTVLGVSVVVLVAVVGFLVVDGLVDEGRPPEPVVTLRPQEAYDGEHGWYLPATVANRGDSAAEAVLLRAVASVGDDVEEAEVTIDYLPSGTEVEVTFTFSAEPDGDVTVRPLGFRLP
jgi:uncharacterized protein (TIGR02588 family)